MSASGTVMMAKKQAGSGRPKGRPKGTTKPGPDRQVVLSIKGSTDFRDWLYELAEYQRLTAVQVIELALVEYARNHGFSKVAPKRTK